MPEQYDPRQLPVVIDIPVEPDFIELPKPRSRTRYLWPIFWGCVGIGIIYLTLDRHGAVEQPVELLGWTNLLPCSYASSFDGTKELGLSEDGRAVLYDKLAKGGPGVAAGALFCGSSFRCAKAPKGGMPLSFLIEFESGNDFNFAVALVAEEEKSPLEIGGTTMPARVVFVQKLGSGHAMPEGIAEYSGGVIISTKADIRGYGFANVGILFDDDTFNKLALAMIEANKKKAVKAFEAAIQACIEANTKKAVEAFEAAIKACIEQRPAAA